MQSDAIALLAALSRVWNDTEQRVRQFPKYEKYLLGHAILTDLDACTLNVLRALQDKTRRLQWLLEASAHYDRAKLKIRCAVQREIIPERWYIAHLNDLADIGRMIGGWQRRTPPPILMHMLPLTAGACAVCTSVVGSTADASSNSHTRDRSGSGSARPRPSSRSPRACPGTAPSASPSEWIAPHACDASCHHAPAWPTCGRPAQGVRSDPRGYDGHNARIATRCVAMLYAAARTAYHNRIPPRHM